MPADNEAQLTIRPAVEADLAHIESFEAMGGSRREEMQAGLCLVALVQGEVIGYASYAPRGLLGQPLLSYVCVAPSHRQRGIGSRLVLGIQQRAQGRKLISSTEDWCVASQHIFERLGWVRIGSLSGINKDGSTELFYAIDLSPR